MTGGLSEVKQLSPLTTTAPVLNVGELINLLSFPAGKKASP